MEWFRSLRLEAVVHELSDYSAVQFADFELRRDPLCLSRRGRAVKLRHQALQLLELLASHPKELVRHNAIRDALWAERVVDHVRGTHLLIREIRQILDDDANQPKFIETVPRYGYRFVAEVIADGNASGRAGETRRYWRYGAIAFTVVGIGVAMGFVAGDPSPASNDRASIVDAQAAFEKGEYLRLRRGTDNLTIGSPDGMAMVAMNRDWNWQRAESGLERALEIDPTSRFTPARKSQFKWLDDLQGSPQFIG